MRGALKSASVLRRARIAAALLGLSLVTLFAIGADAARRRHARDAEQPAIDAIAHRLPTSDLALSGGARWLRAPSLEEPWAAFADAPAGPDPDPAGGMMSPPRTVYEEEMSRGSSKGSSR